VVAPCLGIASKSFSSFFAAREIKSMNLEQLYLQLVGTLDLRGVDRRHEPGPVPCPSVWQCYVLIGSIHMYVALSGVNKLQFSEIPMLRHTAFTEANELRT
jgi:hypothetical protein